MCVCVLLLVVSNACLLGKSRLLYFQISVLFKRFSNILIFILNMKSSVSFTGKHTQQLFGFSLHFLFSFYLWEYFLICPHHQRSLFTMNCAELCPLTAAKTYFHQIFVKICLKSPDSLKISGYLSVMMSLTSRKIHPSCPSPSFIAVCQAGEEV